MVVDVNVISSVQYCGPAEQHWKTWLFVFNTYKEHDGGSEVTTVGLRIVQKGVNPRGWLCRHYRIRLGREISSKECGD